MPWYTRIGPKLRQELEEVRASWLAGTLQPPTPGGVVTKTGLARAISRSLEEHDVRIGIRGVEAWLDEKRGT